MFGYDATQLRPVVDALNRTGGYEPRAYARLAGAKAPARPPAGSGAASAKPGGDACRAAAGVLRGRLRGHVDAWLATGKNLRRCFQEHPNMCRAITSRLRRERVGLLPSDSGPSIVAFYDGAAASRATPATAARQAADRLFITLVTHPNCEALARCARCGEYFFRARRDAIYCSRECGARVSADRATAQRRERDKYTKLRRARRVMAAWTPARGDWRRFVAGRAGVSRNWLAYRVRAGELQEPPQAE